MGCIKLDILEQNFSFQKVAHNNLKYSTKYHTGSYLFGYNGQEKDDEWTGVPGSHLHFTFRDYDTRIGRFFAVDPLSSKYPYWTPYQFAGNMVIQYNELEGLEPNNQWGRMIYESHKQAGLSDKASSESMQRTAKINLITTGVALTIWSGAYSLGGVLTGVASGTMSTGAATLKFAASSTAIVTSIAKLLGADPPSDNIVSGVLRDAGAEKTADVVNVGYKLATFNFKNPLGVANSTYSVGKRVVQSIPDFTNNSSTNQGQEVSSKPVENNSANINSSTSSETKPVIIKKEKEL